jgi:hypothetical protein
MRPARIVATHSSHWSSARPVVVPLLLATAAVAATAVLVGLRLYPISWVPLVLLPGAISRLLEGRAATIHHIDRGRAQVAAAAFLAMALLEIVHAVFFRQASVFAPRQDVLWTAMVATLWIVSAFELLVRPGWGLALVIGGAFIAVVHPFLRMLSTDGTTTHPLVATILGFTELAFAATAATALVRSCLELPPHATSSRRP